MKHKQKKDNSNEKAEVTKTKNAKFTALTGVFAPLNEERQKILNQLSEIGIKRHDEIAGLAKIFKFMARQGLGTDSYVSGVKVSGVSKEDFSNLKKFHHELFEDLYDHYKSMVKIENESGIRR